MFSFGLGKVVDTQVGGALVADDTALVREIERLHLSTRRLIWVNPLLRWEGFAPKAGGIRAMLPHVDCFRTGHSLASLEALARAIGATEDGGDKARFIQMLQEP